MPKMMVAAIQPTMAFDLPCWAALTVVALGGFIFGNRFFGKPKGGLVPPNTEGTR